MRAPLPLLLAVESVALFGCSAVVTGSPEAADAEANGSSAAVIVVERTVRAGDEQASAVARFVRMRSGAVDDDALRMVGAAVDFPALGSCAAGANVAAAPSTSPVKAAAVARPVELLDIGAVALEVNGVRTSLEPRQLPDVVNLLSGVVYSTRAADASSLPERGAYVLRAAGAPELDVAPFAVGATAPGEPGELHVEGQDAASDIVLAAGAAVELGWEAGSPDDVVYVDVAPTSVGVARHEGDSTPAGARCVFADTGHATVASSALGDAWTDGSLTVHRLHREPFKVRGVDAGEIRFDFARTVAFTRR